MLLKPDQPIAVLGGGPAGSAAALALLRQGFGDVTLIEADDYRQAPRIGEAIPPDTRRMLEWFGIWPDFVAQGHEPCHGSCSAWGSAELGYNDFLCNPMGHGWHLDRWRFDAFLAGMARDRGAKGIRARFRQAVPHSQGGWTIELDGDAPIVRAAFIIDATGRSGLFARQRGARQQILDRLTFVVGFVSPHADHHFASRLTFLEATEWGWWYAAQLPQGRVVTALATDPEIARAYQLTHPHNWRLALAKTNHIAPRLQGMEWDGDHLTVVDGVSFLLDQVVGDGWLAVGDAASSYDPISSQGIQKAFTDAVTAVQAMANNDLGGFAQGVKDRFQDYLRNRNYFYAQEIRWPHAPFWQHRQHRILNG